MLGAVEEGGKPVSLSLSLHHHRQRRLPRCPRDAYSMPRGVRRGDGDGAHIPALRSIYPTKCCYWKYRSKIYILPMMIWSRLIF
ncbi:hypothetical protein SETIT_6G080800v2 [Setaria italica]|uniref:Uncharacterized protein n=1 Tax=Setaria italica TaxID=4555 RepID=A0A368RJ87_SETIT|nr:hypothetical protein SETIT_6G080800v2 [Setaria italica]